MALINCSECGKQVSEKAITCPNCGNPITQSSQPIIQSSQTNESQEYLACPACKSKDLHADQKGFSGGKAFAGAVLTGGIGLLAGTIGSKEVIITCLKCGNKFKAGEARTVITGKKADELDDKIAELLIQGHHKLAIELYQRETNNTYGLAVANLARIAGSRNIEFNVKKVIDSDASDFSGILKIILLIIIVVSVVLVAVYL